MKTEKVKEKFYKTNPRGGVSLIVLVITIIVIIILAAAIIISLQKTNPIDEANRARYESDVANMQAIFTNTVAKVMAEKQVTIGIKPCELNEVKSGVNSAVGETTYIIDNVDSGKIIFDDAENTQTDYYTGKKLPIYSSDTTWHVDDEGILALNVGSKRYPSKIDETINNDENELILKRELETLKATVEQIKKEQIESQKNYENLKTSVEKIGEFRAGKVEFGVIEKNGGSKSVHVNFKEPMKDNMYSVTFTCSDGGNFAWGETVYKVSNKSNKGFDIIAVNLNKNLETDNYIANYIAASYTE